MLWYLHLKEWLFLLRKGCLRSHDFDYILTDYKDKKMFFMHCVRCNYTEGMIG